MDYSSLDVSFMLEGVAVPLGRYCMCQAIARQSSFLFFMPAVLLSTFTHLFLPTSPVS